MEFISRKKSCIECNTIKSGEWMQRNGIGYSGTNLAHLQWKARKWKGIRPKSKHLTVIRLMHCR